MVLNYCLNALFLLGSGRCCIVGIGWRRRFLCRSRLRMA
nr:MAG TPA: hypothetical protein [Caudoviricetes sp.]